MKRLITILSIGVGGYLVLCIILYFVQEQFIFQDVVLEEDYIFQMDQPFREETIQVDNGSLNYLYFNADNPKGLIVYFHGNAGNLAGWGDIAEDFVPFAYDVAILDYRGFGKSKGERNESILLDDALVFYDHATENYEGSNIVLFGRSLGTGIASYVASKRNASKIILETPYHDFISLVHGYMPIFPTSTLLKYKLNTYKYLTESDYPVYIFHGTDDRTVPYKQGKKLHEALGEGRSSLYTIQGGYHNNLPTYSEYWDEMKKIL